MTLRTSKWWKRH